MTTNYARLLIVLLLVGMLAVVGVSATSSIGTFRAEKTMPMMEAQDINGTDTVLNVDAGVMTFTGSGGITLTQSMVIDGNDFTPSPAIKESGKIKYGVSAEQLSAIDDRWRVSC